MTGLDAWLTAKEIAELSLPGLPASREAVSRFANDHGWRDTNCRLWRKRPGRSGGGGFEYHVSLLPEDAQRAFHDQAAQAQITQSMVDGGKSTCLQTVHTPSGLSGRARIVMEARLVILHEIKRRKIFDEISQRQAVLSFIADLEKDRAAAPHMRLLAPELFKAAEVANDRRKTLGRSTLFSWLKAFEEGGNAALAPKSTKVAEPLPDWFSGFMQFYARPQKPTIQTALNDYRNHLLDRGANISCPTYRQVRTALGKLGVVERSRGRDGALALKAKMAHKVRDTSDLQPTIIYTADGKTFDAEVQHPIHGGAFKPEITTIVDVFTRKCVGWSVGLAENQFETLDALRGACVNHGIPAVFYADRGPGYKNQAFQNRLTGFMARLGITQMHSLPYNSQARGVIERVNRTIWNPLSQKYATYLGKDMDREAGIRVHRQTRNNLKEFGQSRLMPTWDEFLEDVAEAVVAYNATEHSSLERYPDPVTGTKRHRTPDEVWEIAAAAGFEALTVAPAEADDLFRPYVKRRTNRAQVQWLTNTYFAIELEAYHGEDVIVGYDIHNADVVWVREIARDEDGEEIPGPLICKAKFGGNKTRYIPVTMEQQAKETRAKARRRRLEDKIAAVDAELNPATLLEHQASPLITLDLPAVSVTRNDAPVPVVQDNDVIVEDRPRRFASDTELAAWAIANPENLSEKQRSVLLECLSNAADREVFRLSNIDLDRLRAIVRDAA